MLPTSVRIAITIVSAALCIRAVMDGLPLMSALSGGLTLALLYNQFRHGRLNAGTRYLADGLIQEARHAFSDALRWAEWRGRRTAITAHLNLAMLDQRDRDFEGMRTHLDAAQSYQPRLPDQQRIDLARAVYQIEKGQHQKGRDLLIVLVGQMPPEQIMTWVQGYLSLALLKLGKIPEAVSTIGMAIKPARRDRDLYLQRLVFSVAAKAHHAADNATETRSMLQLGTECGLLEHGDPETLSLAQLYGFDAPNANAHGGNHEDA